MSTLKTNIDAKTVLTFLQKSFHKDIVSVEPIKGGELAQVFFFTLNNKAYVIRVNTAFEHFEKDKYAYEHFTSEHLPIPEMIALGKLNDTYFYAISTRVPGIPVSQIKGAAMQKLMPNLMQTLDTIRTTDISGTSGFGDFDSHGKGKCASWKEFLLSISDEESFSWNMVFTETCFDKTVYDSTYEVLLQLISFCPEERYLIHGDFGFDNVLCDREKVTGVLDWSYAAYGDFLFDEAKAFYDVIQI